MVRGRRRATSSAIARPRCLAFSTRPWPPFAPLLTQIYYIILFTYFALCEISMDALELSLGRSFSTPCRKRGLLLLLGALFPCRSLSLSFASSPSSSFSPLLLLLLFLLLLPLLLLLSHFCSAYFRFSLRRFSTCLTRNSIIILFSDRCFEDVVIDGVVV